MRRSTPGSIISFTTDCTKSVLLIVYLLNRLLRRGTPRPIGFSLDLGHLEKGPRRVENIVNSILESAEIADRSRPLNPWSFRDGGEIRRTGGSGRHVAGSSVNFVILNDDRQIRRCFFGDISKHREVEQ